MNYEMSIEPAPKWVTKSLFDFSELVSTGPFGSLLHKSDYVSEGVPLINPINIVDGQLVADETKLIDEATKARLAAYVLRAGDIVVGRRGEIGRCGVVRSNEAGWVCGTGSFFIRPNPTVDSEFLAHLIRSDKYRNQLESLSTGATMKNLSNYALGNLLISLPPLAEQRRILAVLDEAFAGIAKARASAEQNLRNVRELLDSYLQSVFSQRGDGWRERAVSEISDHTLGKMLDKAKNRGELQLYLRNLNVRWFGFDLDDLSEMRFTDDEKHRYSIVHGDVVICEGGYPGRAAIWDKDESIYFQKALHRVRFHNKRHNRWFLYYLFSQHSAGELKKLFTGTGIQHFTGASLARFIVPIPPDDVVELAVEKIEALSSEVQRLTSVYQQKLAALDELKQSLLDRAFSGAL